MSLKIRPYLHRFVIWCTKTTTIWNYVELLMQFRKACYDIKPIAIAEKLLQQHFNKSHTRGDYTRSSADVLSAGVAE